MKLFSLQISESTSFPAVGMKACRGGCDWKSEWLDQDHWIRVSFMHSAPGLRTQQKQGQSVVLGTLTSGARRVAPPTHILTPSRNWRHSLCLGFPDRPVTVSRLTWPAGNSKNCCSTSLLFLVCIYGGGIPATFRRTGRLKIALLVWVSKASYNNRVLLHKKNV